MVQARLRRRALMSLQRMFVSQHRYLTVIKDQIDFDLMFPDFSTADLIIIISLSGETPSLIPQAQSLSAKGIPFISLTNLKNNLLAQAHSLQSLCAEPDGDGLSKNRA